MSSLGWFDAELLPLSTFDAEIDPLAWFDRNLVGFDDPIRISQSFLSWFDGNVVDLSWFDADLDPLHWFGDEGGPDDFPTLSALRLSVWAASPYAGSPFYNYGSSGMSTTRRIVTRSGVSAPTLGSSSNGRVSADYGPFDPLSIAGCVVWYDLAHNTNAGGVVTALPDQSGNARDASITGGSEPTYVASSASYGNLPVMTFPTSNTKIVTTPDLGLTTGARTFVIVCDVGGGGAFNEMAFTDSVGDTWLRSLGTAAGISVSGDNTGSGVIDDTNDAHRATPQVFVFVENGASSKLYTSALTPLTGTAALEDMTGRTFQLGNYVAPLDAASSQNGSTAQFLVYNSSLSDADVAYLLNGFGAQHGITIGA